MFRRLALALLLSVQALYAAADLEPTYVASGHGNTVSSFQMFIQVNSTQIAGMNNLYANVQYAPLSESNNLVTTATEKVTLGQIVSANKKYVSFTVRGLRETTVYRARLNLYRRQGTSSVHVGSSGFYYTTTLGNDPKSLVRNRMVLKGLNEFFASERGLVGQNGSQFVDGTKYGADRGEAWCSEFYSWVGKGNLKHIAGLSSFKKLIEYFRVGNGLHNRSAIPTLARRGDYLAMDTDGVNGTNHSGMFLAFEKASDGEFVWTLEGNSGNKIKVHRRPFNQVFTHLGHIMYGQF